MTQTKKLVISIIIFFLIIVNVSTITFAALPLFTVGQNSSTRLGLRLLPESKAPVTDAGIEKTMAIIRSRIEKLSAISVTVERSQNLGEEIVVFLPLGVETAQVKKALVNPGRLELKFVAKNTEVPFPTKKAAEKVAKTLKKAAFEILPYEDGGNMSGWVVVERKAVIRANDLKEVKAVASSYGDSTYLIDFLLTPESALRFWEITGEHIGDSLAIVLNNEVKSAPRLSDRLGSRGQISGNFTKQEAEGLAAVLGSGELPHELKIVSEKIISSKDQARGSFSRPESMDSLCFCSSAASAKL